jgi:hypothetical protein
MINMPFSGVCHMSKDTGHLSKEKRRALDGSPGEHGAAQQPGLNNPAAVISCLVKAGAGRGVIERTWALPFSGEKMAIWEGHEDGNHRPPAAYFGREFEAIPYVQPTIAVRRCKLTIRTMIACAP